MVASSGCLSVKAYVDPQLPGVGYADLLARPAARPVSLRVEFHRNGEPATLGVSTAREAVRTVVEKSKLFSSLLDEPSDDVDHVFTATFRTKTYRHVIHSTIGNAEGPPGLVAEESLRAAFATCCSTSRRMSRSRSRPVTA